MLATGFRLGPYEVLAKIGEGGMGEVYRARDIKLGRDVALKILPEPFASDPERLARFRREAQLLAALNHPNIAGIHGLEDSTSTVALVLELVKGETLAERMERGRIPEDDALRIAQQIGDALDAAHERGIIHRDLKPANVKITPDGKVKVLDFGLAKLADPIAVTSTAPASQLPTITSPALVTSMGTILGTAAYMSPEQARGQTVDKRSDIWAFGCILYEMLSGTRLFDGGTTSDALASVLTKQPDWTPIPVKVRSLLQSCLEREPSRRLRDVGDAWRLLDAAAAQPKPPRVTWIVPALVVAAVAFALWGLTGKTAATTSAASLPRLAIGLGTGRAAATDFQAAILSPDGTQIVFVDAGADDTLRLSVRRLDQPAATVLPGTDGAKMPFFSPDGQSVGFFARGKLKTLKLGDADPVILCDAPEARGGTWNEHHQIVAALDTRTHLSLVPDIGGTPTPLTDLAPGELTHRWPQFLPGGNAVVFTVNSTPAYFADASIAVVSLVDNSQRIKRIVLPHAGMSPRYLATGDLVYARLGTLFAVPFDPVRLEVRGKAVAVLEDLSSAVNLGSAQIDFDRQGSALYRTGQSLGRTIVEWLSADGTATPIWRQPAYYQSPRVSPDGTRTALTITDGAAQDVWVYDNARGGRIRLTNGNGINAYPIWTPDGQYVVFQSNGSLWWAHADGSSPAKPLMKPSTQPQFPASFSPNGVLLTFDQPPGGGGMIRTVAINITGGELRASEPVPWLEVNTNNPFPAFSPDGQWIAYQTYDSGEYEVYVRHYPDSGRQWPISIAGGTFPVWSRTSKELFFRTDEQVLMVATYETAGAVFKAGTPREWSPTRLFNSGLGQNFDLAADGRFAALLAEEGQKNEPPYVILALNFFSEVKRRLGQK
jgi:serine/threonine-protein kinase